MRNALWVLTVPDASDSISSSHRVTSFGIQSNAKWQFWSTIQPPASAASKIDRSAVGPCPCPKDTYVTETGLFFGSSGVNSLIALRGSDPGARIRISGLYLSESANDVDKSNAGALTNSSPRFSPMNRRIAKISLSGRMHRRTMRRSMFLLKKKD